MFNIIFLCSTYKYYGCVKSKKHILDIFCYCIDLPPAVCSSAWGPPILYESESRFRQTSSAASLRSILVLLSARWLVCGANYTANFYTHCIHIFLFFSSIFSYICNYIFWYIRKIWYIRKYSCDWLSAASEESQSDLVLRLPYWTNRDTRKRQFLFLGFINLLK